MDHRLTLSKACLTPAFWMGFPDVLRLTDPCSTAVHMEPFSTSVIKVLIWIFATTTKICTGGSSTQAHALGFDAHHHSSPTHWALNTSSGVRKPYAPTARYRSDAPAPSIFRASWFGRWIVTHPLVGSDFRGHRPAVCINQHLLWDLISISIRYLNWVFGSSHSACPAYQKWPTRHSCSVQAPLHLGEGAFLPI